jgi:hypothetical protein
MSSAYGSSVVRPTPLKNVSELLPMRYTTEDNNCVTVNMVDRTNETELLVIHEMLNHEIRQGTQNYRHAYSSSGNSYPQEHELDRQGFENYFLSADAFIVRNQTNNVVGCFYIKPNFPGRCVRKFYLLTVKGSYMQWRFHCSQRRKSKWYRKDYGIGIPNFGTHTWVQSVNV